eukprot:980968_1
MGYTSVERLETTAGTVSDTTECPSIDPSIADSSTAGYSVHVDAGAELRVKTLQEAVDELRNEVGETQPERTGLKQRRGSVVASILSPDSSAGKKSFLFSPSEAGGDRPEGDQAQGARFQRYSQIYSVGDVDHTPSEVVSRRPNKSEILSLNDGKIMKYAQHGEN